MLNLYTETSFQVGLTTSSSQLNFQIPRLDGSHRKSKYSTSRKSAPRNEASFTEQYAATQSSIYFRQAKAYPRTFLWRVLSDDKVLEVQCADLARSENDKEEAYLTLSFTFQDPIIPAGVSFTDSEKGDEVHAFVCTSQNEIFNLRLPTMLFRNPTASQNVSQWCKPVQISSLTMSDHVHHVYAATPFQFFLSFKSGRLQKLERRGNTENWTQLNYNDKGWGASFLILARGQHKIEYQGKDHAPTTVHGMLASSDGQHLFTICLNHTLRVWNLVNDKLEATVDLLDQAREPSERIQLNPAETASIRLVTLPLHKHPILVTFSPHEGGQFKFWDVKGGLTQPLSLADKYPGKKLSPPDPDPAGNTVWSMTGFDLSPGDDFRAAQLWVLWRNNNYHRLYSVHFDFYDLPRYWEDNWVTCANASSTKPEAPDFVKSDPQDVTTKWLDFLFFPGRYPSTVLETALAILEDSVSAKVSSSAKSKSLQERMCYVVAANVTLRKYDDSQLDYERFAGDTDYQWRSLWRVAEKVNDSREAPLGLAVDKLHEMPWVMMADKCCAIRECNSFELLEQNQLEDIPSLEDTAGSRWPYRKVSANDGEPFEKLAGLIKAAEQFRHLLPPDVLNDIDLALEEEMLTTPELPAPSRLTEIYERIGLADAVNNETYTQLEKDLEHVGGIASLNDEIFLVVLEMLTPSTKQSGSSLQSTAFGLRLLSAGLLDVILYTNRVLWDLLALAVFLHGELSDEDGNPTEFDASEVFTRMVELRKEAEKNLWLATHQRSVPWRASESPVEKERTDALLSEDRRVVSVLEDTFVKAIRPQPVTDRPQAYLLTETLAETEEWVSGRDRVDPEDGTVHIQCNLIARGDLDLATDFLRFQPASPWSTYVKGRLSLAKAQYPEAVVYFRKAAYGLACGKALGGLTDMSAGLLNPIESDHFNRGLPRYFQHILSLFEKAEAYSQAAEYGWLALQALTPGQGEPTHGFKSEILSRLFTAELECLRFESAFDALIQFSDQALQKRCASSLVDAILDPGASLGGETASLEMIQKLPWSIQPVLARHVSQQLTMLADKQSRIPSTSLWSPTNDVDHLKILHAFKVGQQDYRGAVSALYDRLRLIRRSGRARNDPQATALRHALLALINAMTCVAPEEAYILAETGDDAAEDAPAQQPNGDHVKKRRKIIITLDDLRREYQHLLDKCARIERGDFGFNVDGEEGDEDDEDEDMEDDGPDRRANDAGHGDGMQF